MKASEAHAAHDDERPWYLAHHFDNIHIQNYAVRLGMWLFLATEVLLFAGLFLGYTVYRWMYPQAFHDASRLLDLGLGTINTIVLITSSFTVAWAYHAVKHDEIKKAMTGLLDPTFKEQRIGSAVVRETFRVPKVGTIAGCMVQDGRITRSGDAHARLLRDNVVVWEGKLASLRRFKDDVSEVKAGFECGIGLQNYNDVKLGDVIEVFTMERVAAAV